MIEKEISALVVEDDDDSRAMICKMLETACDFELIASAASSAEEAVKILEACRFHLVITDIKLPGASGLELCDFIQQTYPITPVIVVSAMTDINYAIEAMRCRAFDYVVKPFTFEKMRESVERAIRYQEVAMKRYYCEQSLEEEIHGLMLLNNKLREVTQPKSLRFSTSAGKSQKV